MPPADGRDRSRRPEFGPGRAGMRGVGTPTPEGEWACDWDGHAVACPCGHTRLRSPTREKYLRWLACEYPQHLEAYEASYAGRTYLRGAYRDSIDRRVRRLRRKHGFLEGRVEDGRPRRAEQLGLF